MAKKIVFVIVEGVSDEIALGGMLDKIFSSSTVFVHVMRCDITSEIRNNPSNILKKIAEPVIGYANNQHFVKKDFQRVIHIVDTDGAYAPDDCIFEDKTLNRIVYTPDRINTRNKRSTEDRNERKRKNLDKLSSTDHIWGNVPYSVYYMSCNLDHVLYDKQNNQQSAKERDAYDFEKKYASDLNGFKKFMLESEFSVIEDYPSSWNYIRTGKNSLKRHTNFGLCFPETDS